MNFRTTNSALRDAWRALLALSRHPGTRPLSGRSKADERTTSQLANLFQEADEEVCQLIELYEPLCQSGDPQFVVAHLGQSLDGRIAAANGSSRWVTGQADLVHNHRMRALFDAVVVGAGTVCHDDPQLTVRDVEGQSPLRVVIDPRRRLSKSFKLFSDGEAETLLICGAGRCGAGGCGADGPASAERHGRAEVVCLPMVDDRLAPRVVLDELERRGHKRIFIEGGGVTVSRFLDNGCLDRLQITVAPVIIGSGRPSISLPEIDDVGAGLRPRIRNFALGEDVLFECCFDGNDRVD